MAFFDKLSEVAKNIGDKTSDAIETSKLNIKISTENTAAEAELRKIGIFYYERFTQGYEITPEILEFCNTAKVHYDAAAEAQTEIEKIKLQGSIPQTAVSVLSISKSKCASCGMENENGIKFCGSCGTKLPELMPQIRICTSCGTKAAENIKFCPDCGQKMEG